MDKGVEWVPVAAAAQVLSCSRQRVHQLIRDGRLAGRKYSGTVLVSMASINLRRVARQLLLPAVSASAGEGSDGG